MQNYSVQQFIKHFDLQPHPEGGYYKETYRSDEMIPVNTLPSGFKGDRNMATAIYFLLEKGNFSAFHRIKSDECWHFYAGQTLEVYMIMPDGNLKIIKLGNNIAAGEVFQYVVPANTWFASAPANGSSFSFVGCTVVPGFDFRDFELAYASQLIQSFPHQEVIIRKLCRQ